MYSRITTGQVAQVGSLTDKLGSLTLRTILTGNNQRLMRPERLANLAAGRGRLTEAERERLELASENSRALGTLKKRGKEKRPTRVNRGLRDWLIAGKERDVDYQSQEPDEKKDQLKAIRALRFFGVDPSKGTYYVNRRKG